MKSNLLLISVLILCGMLLWNDLNAKPAKNGSSIKNNSALQLLKKSFPAYDISVKKNTFYLKTHKVNNVSADMVLEWNNGKFFPNTDYKVDQNRVILSCGDTLNFNRINPSLMTDLTPVLTQMIYGFRLLPFKQNDHQIKRQQIDVYYRETDQSSSTQNYFGDLYDFYRYFHKVCQNAVVYFKITDVKQVNNHIEITGIILIDKSGGYDVASLQMHLDEMQVPDLLLISVKKNVTF